MAACCPVRALGYHCDCASPSNAAPGATWCDCNKGQRITVRLTLLPRTRSAFSGPIEVPACPSCYREKIGQGTVLSQQTVPQ